MVSVERRQRRTAVEVELVAAAPLQRYGFEVDYRYTTAGGGTVSTYLGAGTTGLRGDLDLGGFTAPRRALVRFAVHAESDLNSCHFRGIVRPPRRE